MSDGDYGKYRVISFQSKEVVDLLIADGVYYADASKTRECYGDERDYAACNGRTPIWVFQHPCFRTAKISSVNWCHMLQNFKEEMCVKSLDGLYMLELQLDKQPPKGIEHNGSSLACVIPEIRKGQVAAIYKISKTDHRYFYSINPVWINRNWDKRLFTEKHIFTSEEYESDKSEEVHLYNYKCAEDYYKDPAELGIKNMQAMSIFS